VDTERAPGTPGLGTWLAAGSAVIVLLAVVAMAASSIELLGRLAERQAMTRVELAGASAREYLRRSNEQVLTDARALADRPTLARLLARDSRRALEPVLRRFVETEELYAAAALRDDGVVAAGGATVPWDEVEAAIAEQGERFAISLPDGGMILTGAVAPVGRVAGARVVALRAVSTQMVAELQEQAGATVRITSFATYTAPPDDPYTDLHTEAITTGKVAKRRLGDPPVYAASVPWTAVTGEMVALIDVELATAEFDSAVRGLAWRITAIALMILAAAVISGLLYGQWLARPLVALRRAAEAIGRGDFSVAVPTASGIGELRSLATTMDDMRRNLVDLTAVLRRRDAEARAVLGGVVEGVYAVDADRVIRYANEQVARMLGRPAEEIVGRFCGDVLRPEPVDGVRPCERNCPIVAARRSGQGREAERLCLPDGSQRSVIIVSAPPTEGRQVQVLRDETELESVRRARDGVLANISHEFRTPLAAQLASLELLQDGVGRMGAEEQRELFRNLERGVLRLMRLIDNLLESVRIEAGQLSIRAQTLHVAEVAEEALALVLPLLAQRRQEVAVELPAGLPTVVGDGQRLVQVFVNLLANAGKYAPEGSTIRIGGELRGAWLAAWVEDEGPGPGESDAAAVFQRFHRAGDVEPDAPGLGLGLWIVRSIIERHGGEVGLERTPAGRTRFFFTLPTGERA
jgi:signal transduction histidine kinase